MQDRGQASLSDRILTEVPRLRVYARMMTNDISIADRGVAETLQDALSDVERLRACQDLRIHLFTILRAILVSDETALGKFKGLLLIENEHIETPISLATALLSLTFESREAVVLRAGLRLPREEAATIIGCELHIYDARVRRSLTRLAELLPQEVLAKALSDAMSRRACSTIDKAFEPQVMLLH
jgi:RNA polymerase sigma-70 factor (ECF subfamily)